MGSAKVMKHGERQKLMGNGKDKGDGQKRMGSAREMMKVAGQCNRMTLAVKGV